MDLTRALFPKPTLLVTARDGTVFRTCLIFFSPDAGSSHRKWQKQTCFPPPTFVQDNFIIVTVLFAMRSPHQKNALLMTVKISKVLFTNTLIYCVIHFFCDCDMPLPYQLSRGHWIDAGKHTLICASWHHFFRDIPSNAFQTEIPQFHYKRLWYYKS